MIVITISHLS